MSRPLLPNLQSPAPSSAERSPGDPTPPVPRKPTYAKRGKITIVACVPCRKRKTKCDGKRPQCGQCAARDGRCLYDMTEDERRLTFLRDQSDQLQEKQHAFKLLLDSLQSWDVEDAQGLFRRLRNGGEALPLAELIRAGQLPSRESGQRSPFRGTTSGEYSGVGSSKATFPSELTSTLGQSNLSVSDQDQSRIRHFERLLEILSTSTSETAEDILERIRRKEDIATIIRQADSGSPKIEPMESESSGPLVNLEADWQRERSFGLHRDVRTNAGSAGPQQPWHGSWTTVTGDDELVEHLLRLYFTWQHGFFQNFPEDLFREDMDSGRTKYCSSALVNAICAAACFLSYRKHLQEDREGSQSFISGFFDETLDLLNKTHEPSLPTTAATYLISYVEGYRGNSAGQWMLGGRSALMALDLHLHLRVTNQDVSGTVSAADQLETDKELLARSHAFWGCFHVMQLNSFTLGRLPLFSSNSISVAIPELNHEEDERPWDSYELSLPNRPGAGSSTFRQCAMLSMIVNGTQLMFYAPNEPLTGARLVEDYEKYKKWFQDLPEIVRYTDHSPPHVLCLHMYYHSAVLLLFRPFLRAKITNTDIVPRDLCRDAANAISLIWLEHRMLYGLSGIWQFQVNCLLIASTIHIVNLPAILATRQLTDACNTFQDLIRWHGWAKSAIDSLQRLVRDCDLILPGEVEHALYRNVGKLPADSTSPMSTSSQRTSSIIGVRQPPRQGFEQQDGHNATMTLPVPPQADESHTITQRSGSQTSHGSRQSSSRASIDQGQETPNAQSNTSRRGKRQSMPSTATSPPQTFQSPTFQQKRQRVFAPSSQPQLVMQSQTPQHFQSLPLVSQQQLPPMQMYERSPASAGPGQTSFKRRESEPFSRTHPSIISGLPADSMQSIAGSSRPSSFSVPQAPPMYAQAQWPQGQFQQDSLGQPGVDASSFMYNPFPIDQLPMLLPAQIIRDQQEQQQQANYRQDQMMTQDPGGHQGGRVQSSALSSAQADSGSHSSYSSQWKESLPIQENVQGLSFGGDDWRGPSMPFPRQRRDDDDETTG